MPEKAPYKITVDTETVPLVPALDALRLGRVQVNEPIMTTTDVAREVLHGGAHSPELSRLHVDPNRWKDTGKPKDVDLFAGVALVSPGTAQQRQMFCTHVREGRDIFVTDGVKAFGGEYSAQRERLEELGRTRIMTLAEFGRFCQEGVTP